MIKFSLSNNSFYSYEFEYSNVPSDVIEISDETHTELLKALNTGCVIFPDLTYSEPKPSPFHVWDEGNLKWIDPRTDEEITAYNRSLLPVLPKRQFALYLYDHQLYDQVMSSINANPRFKIEYDSVSDIERLSPAVSEMTTLLEWSEEQVDQMWQKALAG